MMKKNISYLLLILITFALAISNVSATTVTVRKKSGTQGGTTFDYHKTFALTNGTNATKSNHILLSALTYITEYGTDAYCLQSELPGPENGWKFECGPSVGEVDSGSMCIIKQGLEQGYSQQAIEYALKLNSTQVGYSTGYLYGSGKIHTEYGAVYRVIAQNVSSWTTIVKETDVFSQAVALYNNRNCGLSAEKNKIANVKLNEQSFVCTTTSCTLKLILEHNLPADAAKTIEISAKKGNVSRSGNSITVSNIPVTRKGQACGDEIVTVKYNSPANTPLLCQSKNRNLQKMIVLTGKGEKNSDDFTFKTGNCDDLCKVKDNMSDCATNNSINESNEFHECIIDGTACDGTPYNETITNGNKYCSISCKEDIEFTMPTSVYGKANISKVPEGYIAGNTFSGRYFNLDTEYRGTFGKNLDDTVKTKGTKTCVTAGKDDIEEIGYDKFCEDVFGTNGRCVLNTSSRVGYNNLYAYNYNLSKAYEETLASGITSGESNYSCNRSRDTYDKNGKVNGSEIYAYCDCTSASANTNAMGDVGSGVIRATASGQSSCFYDSCGGGSSCSASIAENSLISQLKSSIASSMGTANNYKSQMEKAFKDIVTCTTFENNGAKIDYEYQPEIELIYSENYNITYNRECLSGNCENPSGAGNFSTEPSNNDFSNVTGGNDNEIRPSVYNCVGDVCSSTIQKTAYRNKAVKRVYEVSWGWRLTSHFMSTIPSGVIKDYIADTKNTIDVGSVYPISITTPGGTYEFKVKLTNIGENGRFNNNNCIVDLENRHVCPYQVENEIINPYCPECDDLGINYFYRPIYLYDVFPNSEDDVSEKSLALNRTLGSNWSSPKGQKTQEEIENIHDNIYNKNARSDMKKDNIEYSYTLTPKQMSRIRNYNNEQEKNGGFGYADFNLNCDSLGFQCKSDFLSGLLVGCKGTECFTDNLSQSPLQRNVTFIPWEDGTSWK